MQETKTLTADQLCINQEFLEYRIGNCNVFPFRKHIKEIRDDCVVIYDKTRPGVGSEEVSRDALFEVELTEEEFNVKYYDSAKEIYDILSGGEYVGDHGYHEMYNGWLGSTCQKLYANLKKENWTLIGWFWLQNVKHGWFNDCDIGIIVEDEDSERFWCHYSKESIDEMCTIFML